jgi:AcrR family transcriptional regulator
VRDRPTELDAGGSSAPTRRAPFGDNPNLGARALRTQQRVRYDRTTLERIAQLAGCSRVTIYQYFSGKDDVFRHLAGQVARQLRASMEALGPVTPDASGHAELRAWVGRYADTQARYEPVFRAFDAARASDAQLADAVVRIAERDVHTVEARIAGTDLPPRLLGPVVALVLAGVDRALLLASMLRSVAPDEYTPERVALAIADVVHRVLFGVHREVNVHPAGAPPPILRLGGGVSEIFERVGTLEAQATEPNRRALASILEVGDDVVVRRGHQGVRVDDVIEAAGVSHGSFYTYFENVEEFLRVLGVRAVRDMSDVLRELPPAPTRASLRRWLRGYNAVHAAKGPLIRVWVEAVEDALRDERAAVFDWGRRRLVHLLRGREFGDVEVDALVLLAFVEVFGALPRTSIELDAAMAVLERGFRGDERS